MKKCTSAFEELPEEEQKLIQAEVDELMNHNCPSHFTKDERWKSLLRTKRGRELIAMFMVQPIRCGGKDYSK